MHYDRTMDNRTIFQHPYVKKWRSHRSVINRLVEILVQFAFISGWCFSPALRSFMRRRVVNCFFVEFKESVLWLK